MNTNIIDEALLFYEIYDKEYKLKCYECLKKISDNYKLLNEFNELYNELYIEKYF